MVEALGKNMANRFHKMAYHLLLSEAATVDPTFKKRAFHDDRAADEAYQQISNAAAKVTITNQQAEEEEQGAAAEAAGTTRESAVWSDFDEQVSGLMTTRCNPNTEAIMEAHVFLEKPLLPRSCSHICPIRKSF